MIILSAHFKKSQQLCNISNTSLTAICIKTTSFFSGKKLRNGLKYSRVTVLPDTLCIHLKRFRHDFSFSSKISSKVTFPLVDLDMSPWLHPDCYSKVRSEKHSQLILQYYSLLAPPNCAVYIYFFTSRKCS